MIADPSELDPLEDEDFPLGDGTTETEVVVDITHPAYRALAVLPEATRKELADDLAS